MEHSTPQEARDFTSRVREGLLVQRWADETCRRDPKKAWAVVDMYVHFETWFAKTHKECMKITAARRSIFFNELSAQLKLPPALTFTPPEGVPVRYRAGVVPIDDDGHDIRSGEFDVDAAWPVIGLLTPFITDWFYFNKDGRWSCEGVYQAFEEWHARKNGLENLAVSTRRRAMFFHELYTFNFKSLNRLDVRAEANTIPNLWVPKRERLTVNTGTWLGDRWETRRAYVYRGIEPLWPLWDEPRWGSKYSDASIDPSIPVCFNRG